jgi:purine-binding chemotaxis protein CheW
MAKINKNKTLAFDPFADLDSEMVKDVLGYRPVELPEVPVQPELAEALEPVEAVGPVILVEVVEPVEAVGLVGWVDKGEPLEAVELVEPVEAGEPLPMMPGFSTGEIDDIFVSLLAQPEAEAELTDESSPLLEFLMSNLEDLGPSEVLSALVDEPDIDDPLELEAQFDSAFSDELFKLTLAEEPAMVEALMLSKEPGVQELEQMLEPPAMLEEEHDLLDEIVRQIDDEVYQPDHSGDVFGLAQPVSPNAATLKRHVVFSVGSTEYAVPILTVSEVVRPLKITPVPNVPEWVIGVANLRGDIISVVDLRVFFGQAAPESLPSNRMLVVHSPNEEVTTGLIVDRASGIFDLPHEQIRSPSAPIDDKVSPFMQGVSEVNDRLLVVLDLNQLLLSTEMQQFQ